MTPNTNLRLVSLTKEKRIVMPRRRSNSELRPREHLTEREIEKLIAAAKSNRYGQRDAATLLICFRHGLRASELCELQWSDIEFETGTPHIRRAKGRTATTHPLLGDEMRALRALKRAAVSGLQKLVETRATPPKWLVARKKRQGQYCVPGFIFYDHHRGGIVVVPALFSKLPDFALGIRKCRRNIRQVGTMRVIFEPVPSAWHRTPPRLRPSGLVSCISLRAVERTLM